MTMNLHRIEKSSDQLITALRQMTVEQLLQLGTRQVVYLKAGMHDGEMAFVLYGADGTSLMSFDSFADVVDMVAANGLYLAVTH
jgi:hypothetical protein